MPRCLAVSCHSTVPEWLVPRLLTSGCRLSCCAVWPCSHVQLGYSAILLKSCVAPSHLASTPQSTEMPSIDLRPTTISQNNASLTDPTPVVCTGRARRRKLWQSLLLSSPLPTTHSSTVPAPHRRRAGPTLRTSGCARCLPTAK